MGKRNRIPRSALESLIQAGLPSDEIERRLGVDRGYLRVRILRLKQSMHRREREERERASMVYYCLPLDEVHKRYGRPGEYRTAPSTEVDYYRMAKARERRKRET